MVWLQSLIQQLHRFPGSARILVSRENITLAPEEVMGFPSCRVIFAALLCAAPGLTPAAQEDAQPSAHRTYYGNYRISDDHWLGIDRFVTDDGENTMLISDYSSGVVRRLFPATATEFVMGPGFNIASPAELTVRFVKDERANTTGLALQQA